MATTMPEHMRRISTHRAAVEKRAAEIVTERRTALKVAEARLRIDRVLGKAAPSQHRADGGQYISHPTTDDHMALMRHLQNERGVTPSPATRISAKVAAQVHAAAHGPIVL
jgi:hypothetical protein